MRMSAKIAWVAGCCFALAAAASAQMGMEMHRPQIQGVWNPVIGAGAAYEIEHGGTKSQMEIAVVGKETVDGKDGYWLEMTMDSPRGGGQMVTKTLLVLDGSNTVTRRVIAQFPGMDPMEMPMQMMQRQGSQSHAADIRSASEDVGSESVTTPAGTFACKHYRSKDGSTDSWISEKVAPYGLVKSTSKEKTTTLVKVVTDAKDKITGTPKPFDPMGMMQRQQPN